MSEHILVIEILSILHAVKYLWVDIILVTKIDYGVYQWCDSDLIEKKMVLNQNQEMVDQKKDIKYLKHD